MFHGVIYLNNSEGVGAQGERREKAGYPLLCLSPLAVE